MDSHGTLLQINFTGSAYTTVADLGDLGLPEFSRREFESLVQNRDIDSYSFGILRRGALTAALEWNPGDPTHDHVAGLLSLVISKARKNMRILFPDGSAWQLVGVVQAFRPTAPADGKLTAQATIRFSGQMSFADSVGEDGALVSPLVVGA